jgi:hypothetical protein
MTRVVLVLSLLARGSLASAEPAWSLDLSESVGLEDGSLGPDSVLTTDLALARRLHGALWLYLAGRTGSASSGCNNCSTTTGTLREARFGGVYLRCIEDGLLCGGLSAGIGFQRRVMPNPVEYGPGSGMPPDTIVEDGLVGDARAHLQIGLARDFPIAVQGEVGTRYLRGFGSAFSDHLGLLASLGVVVRM